MRPSAQRASSHILLSRSSSMANRIPAAEGLIYLVHWKFVMTNGKPALHTRWNAGSSTYSLGEYLLRCRVKGPNRKGNVLEGQQQFAPPTCQLSKLPKTKAG